MNNNASGRSTGAKAIIAALVAGAVAILFIWGPPPKTGGNGNVMVGAMESKPDSLDPAVSYQAVSWQVLINVYNGLLTYPKENGAKGSILVPDLATEMPTISKDGRTIDFTMRKGVKWGPPLKREVLPSDIKYAIERNLKIASPGSGFYMNIEGADAAAAGKAKEIKGIVVDDDARTIKFKLMRADATFLNVLALPFSFAVPKGTPIADQSEKFIPATGPYMFTKYDPQQRIVLKRNPNFKSWSENTPDGFVDGIDIKLRVNPDNAVTLIKRRKVDYLFGNAPRSKVPQILSDPQMKKNLHIEPVATTSYIYMDTRSKTFKDPRMRQAINWAIDREAMAKLSGGAGEATETILPPLMPGFRDHKLYPGPDLNKARALIAEAGVKPGKIDIWCRTNEPNPTFAVYLQGVLEDLGFQPSVKCLDAAVYFTTVGNPNTHAEIGFGNWGQDFPEASNFIDVLLNGERITPEQSNNLAYYTGKDKEIARINAMLDLDQRAAAWGKLDEEIMKDAPWAPFIHGVSYSLVSDRVDNMTTSSVYDLLFMRVKLKESGGDS